MKSQQYHPSIDPNYGQYANSQQYQMQKQNTAYPYQQQQYSSNNQVVAPQVPPPSQYSTPTNTVSASQTPAGYVNPIYQPPYYGQSNNPAQYQTPSAVVSQNNYGNVQESQGNYASYNYGANQGVNSGFNQQFGQMSLGNVPTNTQISSNNQVPAQVYNQSAMYSQVPVSNVGGYGQNTGVAMQNYGTGVSQSQSPGPAQGYSTSSQYSNSVSQQQQQQQPSQSGYPMSVSAAPASTYTSQASSAIPVTSVAQSSNSNYSLTSHPTNPMYMGVQGVIKETGINPSQQQSDTSYQYPSSSSTGNVGTVQSPGYNYNSQTGAYEYGNMQTPSYNQTTGSNYGNQYTSSSTNVMSMGQANTNPGGGVTDSSSVGVGGQSYVSQVVPMLLSSFFFVAFASKKGNFIKRLSGIKNFLRNS